MINRIQFTFLIFISTFFLFSCTRDEIKENVFECPSSYTYGVDIKPIITENCVGCHSPNGGYLPTLTTMLKFPIILMRLKEKLSLIKRCHGGG